MNKLNKEQQAILECALDKINTFLEEKYKVRYRGNHMLNVYNIYIEFTQYSLKDRIAWYTCIDLELRKITLVVREVERNSFHSKHWYSLHYMSSQYEIFKLQF